jgi:hypothetical protein
LIQNLLLSDIDQLFVKKLLLLLPIPAVNHSAVDISCRPSSSFARITLWEVNEHNSSLSEELSISPDTGIAYDPKYGFHLNTLTTERLQCIAQLNDSIDKLDIIFQFSCKFCRKFDLNNSKNLVKCNMNLC